jgi:hypothetical protein
MRRVILALLGALPCAVVSAPRAYPQQLCSGDCSDDGLVTVDELITMVDASLGGLVVRRGYAAVRYCAPAISRSNDPSRMSAAQGADAARDRRKR